MRFSRRFWLAIAVGCFLTIFLSTIFPGIAQNLSADSLNQRGFILLGEGRAADAFSVWREAEAIYSKEGNEEGIVGTQLNQALAQQALGLHPLACTTLVDALEISDRLCRPKAGQVLVESELTKVETNPVNTIGIRLLGEGLGYLSNLEEGQTALLIAKERVAEPSAEAMSIELALANLYNLSFQSVWQDYSRISYRNILSREKTLSEAVERSNKAITAYEKISSSADEEISAKANLNIIGLLAYILNNKSDENSEIEPLLGQLIRAAQQSYQRLDVNSLRRLPALDSIYTRLNLATNLSAMRTSPYGDRFNELASNADIGSLIEESTVAAEQVGDRRAISAAYGTAGNYLKSTDLLSAAEQYRQALSLAQSVQADDLTYEWAYQLAQISDQEGYLDQVDQYYETALSSLSAVRGDLLAVDSELRFSFRRKVEPVYENYMNFLVLQKNADLQKVIEIHNSLQLAQIENLLRCGRLLPIPKNSKTTVHLINLANVSNTIEVIISQAGQTYRYSVPAPEVLRAAENLAINVQSPSFLDVPEEQFLPYAKLLYDQLLRPAQEDGLLPEGTELSFVLDTPFQSLPVALLHDGQRYLISKYPVSLSIQTSVAVDSEQRSSGLFVGITSRAPSFDLVESSSSARLAPLPETEDEADYVEDYARLETLLDERFTTSNFEKALSRDSFDVVHISTHGQFSSIPEETFLLAWDKPINLAEIGRLFSRARGIDLLFLSACETAAGDEKATLGLAGLAVQSGASNAIATLWEQNSTSSTLLVNKFYEALESGMSKAEALRFAQRTLMASTAFSHPYNWAPFILAAS